VSTMTATKKMARTAAAALLFSVALSAGPTAARGAPSPPPSTYRASLHPQPPIRTFTGTIVASGTTYLLNDDGTKVSYLLDDQETASKFLNDKVTVTGTLGADGIIRVQSIESAATSPF
jgi:Protein of unknown function (DUF5818)